jgi:hypothetical protein
MREVCSHFAERRDDRVADDTDERITKQKTKRTTSYECGSGTDDEAVFGSALVYERLCRSECAPCTDSSAESNHGNLASLQVAVQRLLRRRVNILLVRVECVLVWTTSR